MKKFFIILSGLLILLNVTILTANLYNDDDHVTLQGTKIIVGNNDPGCICPPTGSKNCVCIVLKKELR